ncbi:MULTISPECIES: ribosome maturation factor RimM [Shouchella]|uniref:Ribosome maturation factor RimM n=2 Tax=Shouchella TaxID=2893057 RepID=A0ABY7W6S0_9BACI|nr:MULTISPECIES: ribosome maturation factor RimM [Shouchella]MED4127321.1 ribosome maturation factor RimM [Shouchella miscanthi]WDF03796.1 ribosome maturation factor RimM [Shouchella hunanensis]GAF23333.1 16S rRNA processing protein RimM [Bacillus sp. JCM 19047]
MTNWFNVGRLVNTHGVRGEVRVLSNTDFGEERFAVGSQLKIASSPDERGTMISVKSHRKHKNFDLLTFEGYTNINEVEVFKGNYLYVSEQQLSELGEHEFYYHEIIGCQAVDEDGHSLGVIKDIIETGANDVWVVERKGKKDLLLPYIEDVIKEVNIDEGTVKVHLLEGLDDA